MRNPKLIVKRTTITDSRAGVGYVSLVGANGEKLMTSELYDSTANAKRALVDIEAAMVAYLRSKGYTVEGPEVKS